MEVASVLEAASYAAAQHASQRRKGTAAEPYVNHVLEVAALVARSLSAPDPNLVIAALLHDTVEDTNTSFDDLRQRFGSDVADLVAEVTDDKRLPKSERKRLQVEHAPSKTPRAQQIKIADKIANLRSMLVSPPADWDERRKAEYFEWARRVVDGLPHAAPSLKAEFERVYSMWDGAEARR